MMQLVLDLFSSGFADTVGNVIDVVFWHDKK